MTELRKTLRVNGDVWYLKRIDSTHLYYSISAERNGGVAHVAQLRESWGEKIYDELVNWLHSTSDGR